MIGSVAMKRSAIILACLVGAISANAYDFSGSGFVPSGEATDLASGIALADESGGTITFASSSEPDAGRIQALRSIVAEIRSWKNVAAASISADNSADQLVVSVGVKSFAVDGKELNDALPGGVQLYYSGSVEYDFKVKSGRYVARVRGIYTSEEDMEAAAAEAYANPEAFALARDPAALSKRITVLEADRDRVNALFAALEADRDRLSVALLAALNGSKPISPAAVAKLRELKAADPKLTKPEAQKSLKAAGLPLAPAEISAVFLVYFGES